MWKSLRNCTKLYNGRYKLRMLHIVAINFAKPDDIEEILKSSTQLQKGFIYFLIKPWLQEGLLTSGGDYWRVRRKMLTPAFHFTILKQFANIFEENSKLAVQNLSKECEKMYTNVAEYINDYALHTLCDTTLGCKFESTSAEFSNYKKALHRFGEIAVYRLSRPWVFPDFLFNLSHLKYKTIQTIKTLRSFTSKIITSRLETWDPNIVDNTTIETTSGRRLYSMLDLLILHMKTNGDIDYKGIQEEVDTFVFEGHDTTSVAIVNMLMLLANHTEVQDKILEELYSVVGEDISKISYTDLQSLKYLEMCIKETLRLYPSVPFIARTLTEPLELKDGVVLPKGLLCNVHIYDLHHDAEYWPEPEKFIPERFTEENCAKRNPFSYVPFSAGPRNCIGQKFAILQMKSIISNILFNYILEPIDTPESITLLCDLVIRTEKPVRVKLRKRIRNA
ncbi:cytochrome P450 4C1-like [Chrysoperla carnea]|uniref:cytochrome P450 4C1-like n=1 Tax=Chrysoperla carnea TaxID=189513 RepID=UPI001D0857C5|nr:cytochrome P450 4C1-like [Chrysoperla carnea]